jgi:hypothetical protein
MNAALGDLNTRADEDPDHQVVALPVLASIMPACQPTKT